MGTYYHGMQRTAWRHPACAAVRRLTMAVANRLGGLAFGLLEAVFVKFYQYVVDPAPAGSWPFRFFEYLAKGPFKCARAPPAPCLPPRQCCQARACFTGPVHARCTVDGWLAAGL